MAGLIFVHYFIILALGLIASFIGAEKLWNADQPLLAILMLLTLPAGWLLAKLIPWIRTKTWATVALAPALGTALALAASLAIPHIIIASR